MNFFAKIAALLVAALSITNQTRKALLETAINKIAAVQAAALKFDGLVGTPGASSELGDGLIELAGLFTTTFPNLDDTQKAAVKEAVRKTVDLPEGSDEAELAAEEFFNTLVDALDALQELVADENLPT